jgi:hypothetical protein
MATMEARRRELMELEAKYRREKNETVKEVNHKLVSNWLHSTF